MWKINHLRLLKNTLLYDFNELLSGTFCVRATGTPWEAAPKNLRKVVDDFNAAPQQAKDRFIEELQRKPELARNVGQMLDQRQRVIEHTMDRGHGIGM